ncbi:hypothetical protein DPMN_115435 [Dreissena polymorpha]|uniref:Uncharacterized protein n=1 Tax=Dreissena polymorpha TaxID=45954 RepID=A0A9D4QSX0_DREPO|nr:hypothetical protein DPMN_115435 [Dreissena polymorpha]
METGRLLVGSERVVVTTNSVMEGSSKTFSEARALFHFGTTISLLIFQVKVSLNSSPFVLVTETDPFTPPPILTTPARSISRLVCAPIV